MTRFILGFIFLATLGWNSIAFPQISINVSKSLTPKSEIVTLDSELSAAISHLEKVSPYDRPFIKFFTFLAFPSKDYQDSAALVLSFWLHSLIGPPNEEFGGNTGTFYPIAFREEIEDQKNKTVKRTVKYIQRVRGSSTLVWIDIRDYNWTEKSFEKISGAEPYVRKPWINEESYDNLRLNSGNALLRADWFIAHTSDVSKQVDNDIGGDPFYYVLLYSNFSIPKTGDEYRKIWEIDLKRVTNRQLSRGAVINKGESIVSRWAREIAGIRSENGYHYETSDFKNNIGKLVDGKFISNDPLENLSIERDKNGRAIHKNIARNADAHEYITSNYHGLQVYFITNGNQERVETGDPTIVVDTRDLTGDIRVRSARSCVVCHPIGLNPPSNALREHLEDGIDLVIGTREYEEAAKKFYLSNDLGARIQDDQVLYARAVVQTNGLLPEDNARLFQRILDWYDDDISLEQAARECGVSVEIFKEKVGKSTVSRLGRLVASTKDYKIPRALWDNPKGGYFAQAMLLIKEVPLVEAKELITIEKDVDYITTIVTCNVMLGKEIVEKSPIGSSYQVVEKIGEWYKVKVESKLGFGYIYEKYGKISKTK